MSENNATLLLIDNKIDSNKDQSKICENDNEKLFESNETIDVSEIDVSLDDVKSNFDSGLWKYSTVIDRNKSQQIYPDMNNYNNFNDLINKSIELFNMNNVHNKANLKAFQFINEDLTNDIEYLSKSNEQFNTNPWNYLHKSVNNNIEKRVTKSKLENFENSGFPEYDRMMKVIVENGITPNLGSDFEPNPYLAKVRKSMSDIQPALNVLASKAVRKGEAIIVSYDIFLETIEHFNIKNVHMSEIHHRYKEDDDLGRMLFDYTNLNGGEPINTETLKDSLENTFGCLKHPSVASLLNQYYVVKECFPNEILKWSKQDISGAFNRLLWSLEQMLLFSIRLSDDLVLIPLTVGFGTSIGPYGFGPISRLFVHMHKLRISKLNIRNPSSNKLLDTLGDMYADDNIICGPHDLLVEEQINHHNDIVKLIGDDGENMSKRSIGVTMTILGIHCDNKTELACPSWRAYLKLIYAFFVLIHNELKVGQRISIKIIQTIASLALRYSQTIPMLKFTSSYLFKSLRGIKSHHTEIKLNNNIISSIKLWRVVLRQAFQDPCILQSPYKAIIYNDKNYLNSAINDADFLIWTDAATNPVRGLGIYCSLGWLDIIWPIEEPIATLEMLAAVIGYMFAMFLNPKTCHVHMFIDNKNAEAWLSGRIHSESKFACSLVILNSFLQDKYKQCVQTKEFLSTIQNHIADAISRQKQPIGVLLGPRYRLTENCMKNLINMSTCLENEVFQMSHLIHMIVHSINFIPF